MLKTCGLKINAIKPWIICASSALFFFYQFMQLSLVDTFSFAILNQFAISQNTLANISATYLLALVIFYIPAGYLFDRYSNKRLIIIALFASILAAFGFAMAQTAWQIQLMRLISGMTHCFAFLGCMRLTGQWLSHKLGLAMGINFTIGFLGGIAAHTPMVMLINAYDWRTALVVNALLGVLILLIICLLVANFPSNENLQTNNKPRTHFMTVVLHKQNWLCALYNMLLNLPIIMLAALWGTMYLMQQAHLTQVQASTVMAMIFNGAIFGSPFFGWLSEKMKSRKYPVTIAANLALLTIILIFWLPYQSYFSLLTLYFILGFSSGAQAVAYSSITESNTPEARGLALSITSIIILGGGGLSQKLFGYILEFNWAYWLPNLSYNSYEIAFFLLPLSFIICLWIATKIGETFNV